MHLGLTYDLRDDYLARGWTEDAVAEFDRLSTVDALAAAIGAHGHTVERIGGVVELMQRLLAGARWELVFNIAESCGGIGREALVPALLDAYGVPVTFADPLVCALTLDKAAAKRMLRDLGLPTTPFAVIAREEELAHVVLPYPVFAKPLREGSSKGVGPDSRADDAAALARVCRRLLVDFAQPVLVEPYLPGREVTVGILGTGPRAEVVGVLEVVLLAGAEQGAYTYQNKELCEELCEYRLVADDDAARAAQLALAAYRGLGCRDGGRVDLRQDGAGAWQIIEANPLPGLHPSHSDLPIVCHQAGISYEALIGRIVSSASERVHAPGRRAGEWNLGTPAAPQRGAGPAAASSAPTTEPPTPATEGPVLILHDDLPPTARADEQDALAQAQAVAAALAAGGLPHQTRAVGLDLAALSDELARLRPRLVFNLVESLARRERLVHVVPTVLDALGVPYTGCSTSAIFQTSDKLVAKRLLAEAGLPTPPWFAQPELARGVTVPAGRYLLKAIAEHGSVGLDQGALVDVVEGDELARALAARAEAVGTALFAEAFIDGREFNLALLAGPTGGASYELLPPAEIVFEDFALDQPRIVDYRAKWDSSSHAYHHTPRRFDFPASDQPLLAELSALARHCWALFELGGYARVDFRVDAAGRPWVLEINTNPCLSPDAGFAAAAARAGLSFTEVVARIVAAALPPSAPRGVAR